MASPFDDEVARQLRRMPKIRTDTIAEIIALLEEAERAILGRLSTANATARVVLLQQQADVRAALERFQRAAQERLDARLGEAWRAGNDLWREPARFLEVGPVPRIGDRALLAMRAFTTGRIKDLTATAVDRINRILGQVITGTLPASDAITAVQRQLQGATRSRATGIVYQNIGLAYSKASYESMLAAEQAGVAIAKRWLKSGKQHPRPGHVAAHNQVVRVSQPFRIADPRTGEIELLRYPRDEDASPGNTINCGCIAVPAVNGSTFGASVLAVPADRSQPVRVVSRAQFEAAATTRVEQVNDRLARYLGHRAKP